jgi:hypothetical protein
MPYELIDSAGSTETNMLTSEYLRHHVDVLSRLSRDGKDPAVSAKLQEMADELRIIVSVADIAALAAELKGNNMPAPSRLPPAPADVVPFKRRDRSAARHR